MGESNERRNEERGREERREREGEGERERERERNNIPWSRRHGEQMNKTTSEEMGSKQLLVKG